MDYILAADLGTSAIKVALFDSGGRQVASANNEYALLTPSPLVVEMEVEQYWIAFKAGVRKVLADSGVDANAVKAIGLSNQGETLICVDGNGAPLRPAIVWMDSRAQDEADHLAKRFADADVYGITGQVSIVATWPAAKIEWLKRHEPETFKATAKFLLIEDYFIHRMSGSYAAEGSLLCSTVYWDITTKKYWPDMLTVLGISEDRLPPIYESGEVIGPLKTQIARELGLSDTCVVCTGVLDQVAGAIGVGNVQPGVFSESTGSALAIVATVDHPFKDPGERMPCHYHGMPDTYLAHTFTTGGMVLKWFRDRFCEAELNVASATGIDAYDLLGREAAKIPPGSDGLVMLPHLQGAMAPENDPKANGVFYGLTLMHGRGHFVRAIMEGISFILRRNIEVIEDLKIPVTEIRSLGGGARSDFWCQMKADITGKPVVVSASGDEACLGAAIVAGAGTGLFPTLQDASRNMVTERKRFVPDPSQKAVYDKRYQQYVDLYGALKPMFAASGSPQA